jgi:hypothetical protein
LSQRDAAAGETVSTDRFDQMEAKIFAHVAMFPNDAITDLRIKCEERGCIILMQGRNIQSEQIRQFDFHRFAEENGFLRAEHGGFEERRIVTLRN